MVHQILMEDDVRKIDFSIKNFEMGFVRKNNIFPVTKIPIRTLLSES